METKNKPHNQPKTERYSYFFFWFLCGICGFEVEDYKKDMTRREPFHPKMRIHSRSQFLKHKVKIWANVTFGFGAKQNNSLFLAQTSTVNPLASSHTHIFCKICRNLRQQHTSSHAVPAEVRFTGSGVVSHE